MKENTYLMLNKLSELIKYDSEYNIEYVLNKLVVNYIGKLLNTEYVLTSEQIGKLQSVINHIMYHG